MKPRAYYAVVRRTSAFRPYVEVPPRSVPCGRDLEKARRTKGALMVLYPNHRFVIERSTVEEVE